MTNARVTLFFKLLFLLSGLKNRTMQHFRDRPQLTVDEIKFDVQGDLSQNRIAADALAHTDTLVEQLLLNI